MPATRGRWPTSWPTSSACRYLQAIGPYEGTVAEAAEAFGALCDRAAAHGLLVGIEWLPYTNIATAADAQAIVEAAGRPNGGYCADIWHHRRGADDESLIRALPGDRVFAVQMNDGPRQPQLDDYKQDCLANRVPPGEGEFDCVGFVRLLTGDRRRAPRSRWRCARRSCGRRRRSEAATAGGRRHARRARRGRPTSTERDRSDASVRSGYDTSSGPRTPSVNRPGGKASSTCSTLSHSCTTVRWAILHSPSRRSKRST